MYDHTKQYRCIIIRGKAKKKLDDLLPAYAMVIDDICPCVADEFESKFNSALSKLFNIKAKESDQLAIKKTLDNHRTEIAGKLFGMYFHARDGIVYPSERTAKYLSDMDQPAFFKDVCYKMQFPSGMNSMMYVMQYTEQNIKIRQYPFIIKVLSLAEQYNILLSASDIGYYILNSLDVLKGDASAEEVIGQIVVDRSKGIYRKIIVEGKASSYTMQHINEQLNYLELANLIYLDEDKNIKLNHKEDACLKLFITQCSKSPEFDCYAYDLNKKEDRESFYYDWDYYFSKISNVSGQFNTSVSALVLEEHPEKTKEKLFGGQNLTELGDEGEQFVYEYERKRVAAYNPRLVNKVLPVGKTKGLGFDIQSVIAKKGDDAEFVKYIEVKSTKRVTAPNLEDAEWLDTINITRNEYVAAMQHKNFYSIYRVYFVRDGIVVFIIDNVFQKQNDGLISIVPTIYRVDFKNVAIDNKLEVRNV